MPIIAYSLDYDGCLSNKNVLDDIDKKLPVEKKRNDWGFQGPISLELEFDSLKEHNKKFLDNLKAKANDYDKTILFCGSNRQDASTEFLNSAGKIVCFPHLQGISEYIVAELNPMLLADIYNDLEPGNSLNKAMLVMVENGEDKANRLNRSSIKEQPEYIFDETKMTLIYAQIHSLADSNPEEGIVFEFYDDKEDILESLNAFFSNHEEAIPSNVTLNLYQYTGNDVTPKSTIKGKGSVDHDYKNTLKYLGDKYYNKIVMNGGGFAENVSDDLQKNTPLSDFVKYEKAKLSLSKLADSFAKEKRITAFNFVSSLSGRATMLSAITHYSNLSQKDCQGAMENLRHYYYQLPKEQRENGTKDKMIKKIRDIVEELPPLVRHVEYSYQ